MAKKPLGEPKAPRGPQYRFFDLLQRTVRSHGDLSLEKIIDIGLYCSRQVLHRALVGPTLPSRKLVEELLRVLKCSEETTRRVLTAFEEAEEDRIQRLRRIKRGPTAVPVADWPTSSATNEFRDRLVELHRWSGAPSLRGIERWIDIPASTVHGWLGGEHVPASYDTLKPLLEYLTGKKPLMGDANKEWEALWRSARNDALAQRRTRRFS